MLAFLASTILVVETEAPVRDLGASGESEIDYRALWAIARPLRMAGEEPPLSRSEVSASFESFGRSPAASSVERKREETMRFVDNCLTDRERAMRRLTGEFLGRGWSDWRVENCARTVLQSCANSSCTGA